MARIISLGRKKFPWTPSLARADLSFLRLSSSFYAYDLMKLGYYPYVLKPRLRLLLPLEEFRVVRDTLKFPEFGSGLKNKRYSHIKGLDEFNGSFHIRFMRLARDDQFYKDLFCFRDLQKFDVFFPKMLILRRRRKFYIHRDDIDQIYHILQSIRQGTVRVEMDLVCSFPQRR